MAVFGKTIYVSAWQRKISPREVRNLLEQHIPWTKRRLPQDGFFALYIVCAYCLVRIPTP
jgi:hypothetical protein